MISTKILSILSIFVMSANGLRYPRGVIKRYNKPPSSTIYYTWDPKLDEASPQHSCITQAMEKVQKSSCVKFRHQPVKTLIEQRKPYILFQSNDDGVCTSFLGLKTAGPTMIALGAHCGSQLSTCVHELLHALGMTHEHERENREKYVHVIRENIKQSAHGGYAQYVTEKDYEFTSPYDVSSIMHYGSDANGVKKGARTMETKANPIMEHSLGVALRGDRQPLSHRDKAAINKLFECQASCPTRQGCAHGGFVDDSCACVCPYGFAGKLCESLALDQHYSDEVCGKKVVYADEEGFITSPNYPLSYRPNTFCQFLVETAEPHLRIQFRIEDMDMQFEDQYERCKDTLQIWPHGTDVVTKRLSCYPDDVERYKSRTYTTQNNYLMVEMGSGLNLFQHRGFNISYKVVDGRPSRATDMQSQSLTSESQFSHLKSSQISCLSCTGVDACTVAFVNMTMTKCQTAEACATTTASSGAITWRGCLSIDECQDNLSDSTECCAHDACNGANVMTVMTSLFVICVMVIL